jgi:hypothetical protein
MTLRRSAPLNLALAMMSLASVSRAGVWGIEPVVGVAADHSTNPALLQANYAAETHAALLLDSPTTYNADAVKFTVLPSFRLSDSAGYSSLASNYARLNVLGEIDTERSSLSASGGISRDSSLYRDYLFNGSFGVRRDTATADVKWDRALTERSEFSIDVNSLRVRYGHSSGAAVLTDYSYSSAVPALSWQISERTKLTGSGGIGLYQSSDGATKSVNTHLELGFVRQLTELWALTANAGISKETDQFRRPFGTLKSTNNGTVFKASLTRQASLFSLSAAASRQLTPSGLAFLSRQDAYELHASYPYSERLSFMADARRVKLAIPQFAGPAIHQSYSVVGLTTTWRWTEKWTLTANATYITTSYAYTAANVAATEISLALSRHFNRITLP